MSTRRSFLIYGVGVVSGAAGLQYSKDNNFSGIALGDVSESDPMSQSLGAGFDRVEFSEEEAHRLYFEEDHRMQAFSLRHSYDSSKTEDIVQKEAADYAGPIEMGIIKAIRNAGREFPNREFKFVAYENHVLGVDPQNPMGSTKFKIPETFDIPVSE